MHVYTLVPWTVEFLTLYDLTLTNDELSAHSINSKHQAANIKPPVLRTTHLVPSGLSLSGNHDGF